MNPYFPEIKKNFGFGCMRFPLKGEAVDVEAVKEMVDTFLTAGFNYFDTARPYHYGTSESVVKQALTDRYPRESYVLTDKLSPNCFEKEEDILPFFESQLERCGVDYFDFYLIHANSAKWHEKYKRCNAYAVAKQLQEAGKVRHVGMSFHDSAQVLDQILTEQPEIEVVQLQFNYVDYEDPQVQSRECYEVCRKHGKPVLVMEPVKGGSLVDLPQKALDMLDASPASYAIRFAAGFDGIFMVLSGMSNLEQMKDNISFMQEFKPLSEQEQTVIEKVRTLYQAQHRIPCTACRYCTEGCPMEINIPEVFACLNDKRQDKAEAGRYYSLATKADSCIGCGQCETACPQKLRIRDLLEEVAAAF